MTIVRLGRAECGDFASAARREWLVTNGLGGYAMGTVAGLNTRRYHGLLVAALRPPLDRTVLVGKVDAVATYDGREHPLATNVFADGTVDPHGYRLIAAFALDGTIPVWSYAIADAVLEQRVWMAHGHGTTYLTFTLARASLPLTLTLTPLCTYRDYHRLQVPRWSAEVRPLEAGFELVAYHGAQAYRVVADRGAFNPLGRWYHAFKHPVETERGFDDLSDLFVPGHFRLSLMPGESATVVCSTEAVVPHAGDEALAAERSRQARLLRDGPRDAPGWVRQLVLAADQFVVRREGLAPGADGVSGVTVIAGYPWFTDWGRDTMIALPGLALSTGRPEVAARVLRTYADYVSEGMLPNRFPDAGEAPDYNAVDATLWYFHAVGAYVRQTGDLDLTRALYPVLAGIVDWHERGTRYGIRVDPADGLLRAGAAGTQLTWMDAKAGGRAVTPRIGKPVEVNALWHHALRVMADLSGRLGDLAAAARYADQADRVAASFRARFWYAEGGYLYDVVDGPEGAIQPDGRRSDPRLRPNQIVAVALPDPLLEPAQARAVVDVCGRRLWTSHGLRTLAEDDPEYAGQYAGGPARRDGAYHQGTAWAWLLGPFATAHYRVYGDAEAARSYLSGIADHLSDAGLGSVSEIFDGDPPHRPDGCPAQAWSVAEVLRAWVGVGRAG